MALGSVLPSPVSPNGGKATLPCSGVAGRASAGKNGANLLEGKPNTCLAVLHALAEQGQAGSLLRSQCRLQKEQKQGGKQSTYKERESEGCAAGRAGRG